MHGTWVYTGLNVYLLRGQLLTLGPSIQALHHRQRAALVAAAKHERVLWWERQLDCPVEQGMHKGGTDVEVVPELVELLPLVIVWRRLVVNLVILVKKVGREAFPDDKLFAASSQR